MLRQGHCIALAFLHFTTEIRLVSNSRRSACFSLLRAGIKGMQNHAPLLPYVLSQLSCGTWAHWLGWTDASRSQGSSHSSSGTAGEHHCAWFLCGARDLNSDPYACTSGSLLSHLLSPMSFPCQRVRSSVGALERLRCSPSRIFCSPSVPLSFIIRLFVLERGCLYVVQAGFHFEILLPQLRPCWEHRFTMLDTLLWLFVLSSKLHGSVVGRAQGLSLLPFGFMPVFWRVILEAHQQTRFLTQGGKYKEVLQERWLLRAIFLFL